MSKPFLALVLAAAAAGCGSAQKLNESQEYYVGRGVAANAILASKGVETDPGLTAYVDAVGQMIALESDRPETFRGYHFAVLRSDAVNAFAAPGGFVFVTTAALRHMQNEDELAGVLAHEVAHVNLHHPEEQANDLTNKQGVMNILSEGSHKIERAGGAVGFGLGLIGRPEAGAALSSAAANMARLVGAFGSIIEGPLQELMVNGYSREYELQADSLAVEILTRPGLRYDPNALKEFIRRLPPAERGAWSTHPRLEGRIQNIDRIVKEKGVRSGIDPARTARFRAKMAGLRP
jgi:predicted Zn-dependent protease